MKILRSLKAIIILAMIFCTNHITAQTSSKNEIPAAVLAAFAAKYPKAEVKSWKINNEGYTAKAKEVSRKYFATFDSKGLWTKTITTHYWPWYLSTEVKRAFNKTKYGTWHIYQINLVETPSGQFYQVMVDNTTLQIDSSHQDVLTADLMLEFKADGEFIGEKNLKDLSMISAN